MYELTNREYPPQPTLPPLRIVAGWQAAFGLLQPHESQNSCKVPQSVRSCKIGIAATHVD